MDRRETLKSLMVGTIAGAATVATVGCKPEVPTIPIKDADLPDYGRTPAEKEWDQKVLQEKDYFESHEMETIAVLCDIILPAKGELGSATDAGVPEFVSFIVKDLPDNQLPLRGGLMWLDAISNQRYNKQFISCTNTEQISIIDDIAYPDPDKKKPEMGPGIKFFDLMRNLTLTGYYTTKMGFDDLGYKGNVPNVWDGVPAEVLAEYDVDYDPAWIAKCVDQDKREVIAEWDDDMNLIT